MKPNCNKNGNHIVPIIRQECASDIESIRAVVQNAFGRPNEAQLVDRLRLGDSLVLSVVAIMDGRVVGHLALSEVVVGGSHPALALAPVAVESKYQGNGIASAMIRWSLDFSRGLDFGVVIVLGEPTYYERFGFFTASRLGIACPFPVPDEAFMALELEHEASCNVHGVVQYPVEFDEV